jgi:hypothetical protein
MRKKTAGHGGGRVPDIFFNYAVKLCELLL